MKSKDLHRAVGLIAGTSVALALSSGAVAADNPFGLAPADGATLVVAGSGEEKGISVLEGKCGSGKCGSQRVREMMDKDDNGRIDRDEYISRSAMQAGNEFDQFAGGAADVGAEDVYEHFRSLDYHTQG